TGRYIEARDACAAILERNEQGKIKLDTATVQRIQDNLRFSQDRIAEQQVRVDTSGYSELLLGAGSRTHKDLVLDGISAEFNNLIRLDHNRDHAPDVVWDLRKHPLPFADASFDEIHAYQVLEYLARQGDYEFFFAEFSEYWRILKPNGLFLASVPDLAAAWADPASRRIIQRETLFFLDQEEYERQVGKTTMSDFRDLYKAHFKTVYSQVRNGSFYFSLRKVMRSR
ncbi:MAG: methyltransferase domain-containing protein, partial [Candidatus Electrothrix sp. EH2]|nr:methyltransferase domain-containing protein [Candidatus Electrothrix sp. EH2]